MKRHRTERRFARRKLAALLATLSASIAAPAMCPVAALAQPPSFRSVNNVGERIPDEQDRPFVRETKSHRGWEVREDQYTIFADTNPEDARWAAAQVGQARGEAARLLDRLTRVHRQADFGLNSLQVVISNQPFRDRNGPLTTIEGVGIQTSVQINVAEGQPALSDQGLRLREAGSFAMLHAAGLDGVLPPWAVSGIATHAAVLSEPEPATKDDAAEPATEEGESESARVAMGGQQWRWKRSAQDQLDEQPLDHDAAAAMVAFLLEGNDAQHAVEFLSLVEQAIAGGQTQAAVGNRSTRRRGEDDPPPSDTPLDQLLEANQDGFEAWKADPLVGRPIFTPAVDVDPDLVREQEEMLVVLKLQRRMPGVNEAKPTKIKVLTFDRQQGKAEAARPASKPADIAALAQRIGDPDLPPLATLDADGRLLLSTDERIEELLGAENNRYRSERSGERWVVATRLEDGRTLQGWLEDNPANASRPLAKFAVVDPAAKPPSSQPTRPPAQPTTTTTRGVKIITR
jgi:hypothetical protein